MVFLTGQWNIFYGICGTMIISAPHVLPDNLDPCSHKASFSMCAVATFQVVKYIFVSSTQAQLRGR